MRIQLRHDTSTNWSTNNPILYPGEFGIETDTLKIKVGPEVTSPTVGTAWNSISTYANITATDLGNSLGDYIELADLGHGGGPAELTLSGNLLVPGQDIIIEGATADSYELTLRAADPTADRVLTLPDATDTLATEGYVDDAISAFDALPAQTNNSGKFLTTDGSTTSWATVDLTSVATLSGEETLTNKTLESPEITISNETVYFDGAFPNYSWTENSNILIYGSGYTSIPGGTTILMTGGANAGTHTVRYTVDYGGGELLIRTWSNFGSMNHYPSGNIKIYAVNTKTVSATELSYLDTVSSNIQDQLDAKATTSYVDTAVGNIDLSGYATLSGTETLYSKTLYVPTIIVPGAIAGIDPDITIGYEEIQHLEGVSSNIQDQIDDKAPLASPTFTGTAIVNDLEIGGSLIFSGTATEISSTNTTIEDPLIYLADGNPGNINDLGFVANYNDGTYAHTGLVKDASAGVWKLFKGVTDEPTNTVNFGQGSLDDIQVGGLTASSITVGSISNTEFGYLNGVTSGIQTQLDAKASLSGTETLSNKTLASPTVTVAGGTYESTTTLYISDSAYPWSGLIDGVQIFYTSLGAWSHTDSPESYIGKKLTISGSPNAGVNGTFTISNALDTGSGAIAFELNGFPGGLSTDFKTQDGVSYSVSYADSTISSTEISYLDGVTSNIQTQLNAKLSSSTASTTYQPLVSGVSDTEIGYLDGVTSAIQDQLDAKIAKSLVDAKGDILVGTADNTVTRLGVGTDGYLLTADSSVTNGVKWAAAPVSLPDQSGENGKYLTTDGSTASWASLVVPIVTGTATVDQNTATTVDTTALSSFTSIEYMVSLKQGSKVRTSKVLVQTDGSSVDMTEYAITETGGAISGVIVSAATASTNCALKVTATDGASTNVTVKFSKVAL